MNLRRCVQLSLAVVAAVLVVSPLLVLSESVVFGKQSSTARLLYATHVIEPPKFFRIIERKLTFRQHENIRIIGSIVIEDQNRTIGGEASVLEGGTSYTFVTLKFKSKRNRGLDFHVYIYDSA